jgi:hypothetical protein
MYVENIKKFNSYIFDAKYMNKKTKNNKTLRHKTSHTYTKEDYNSGDGMLTAVWGPAMWHFLHTMSFNYPVNPSHEDKQHYMGFVKSLVYVLPCKYCRMNLKDNLKKMPITLDTMKCRETFSHYIYRLHEHVNKMLKKESGLSFEEVQERYEHFRARCLANQPPSPSPSTPSHPTSTSTSPKTSAKGCTEPLFGKKSKCLIKIVPIENKHPTFEINKQCIRTRKATRKRHSV